MTDEEIDILVEELAEDVMQGNLDKLASRKERGVIHGDGDNRQEYIKKQGDTENEKQFV